MKRLFLLLLPALMFTVNISAQYSLPSLPYAYDALEPYIDTQTMNIHYNNHHATYVKNLNEALSKYPDLQTMPLTDLLKNINSLPADIQVAVRNNGGGHYNHSLFWTLLTPAGSSKMSDRLEALIKKNFGSTDNFMKEFEKAATGRFGSGWAWLIKEPNGTLRIISTPNQDNPIMSVAEIKGNPILALDVWEHAYYLKYQSKRADYIKAFWEIVNWDRVEELLDNPYFI